MLYNALINKNTKNIFFIGFFLKLNEMNEMAEILLKEKDETKAKSKILKLLTDYSLEKRILEIKYFKNYPSHIEKNSGLANTMKGYFELQEKEKISYSDYRNSIFEKLSLSIDDADFDNILYLYQTRDADALEKFTKFFESNDCKGFSTIKSQFIAQNIGIEIHKVGCPAQIPAVIAALSRPLSTKAVDSLSIIEFKITIAALNLELIKTFIKNRQKSGNCGLSSSAKMAFYIALFVNFLKELDVIQSTAQTTEQAFELANQAANFVYKDFTLKDRITCLKNYFEYCKKEVQKPNQAMMAQIFLKAEHNPAQSEVIKLLGDNNIIISDEDKEAARKELLKIVVLFLIYESKLQKSSQIDQAFLEQKANIFLDAYLKHTANKQHIALFETFVQEIHQKYQQTELETTPDDNDQVKHLSVLIERLSQFEKAKVTEPDNKKSNHLLGFLQESKEQRKAYTKKPNYLPEFMQETNEEKCNKNTAYNTSDI